MLTPKQNMLEVIKGGNPDRFVNQYEAVQLLFHPFMFANPLLEPGQENVVNAWGVTNTFPKGVPGSFPVHTPDKIVVRISRLARLCSCTVSELLRISGIW